jgi:hypothetical protein
MFGTKKEHEANPPETWQVVKVGDRWKVSPAGEDYALDTYRTKKEAVANTVEDGYWYEQYQKYTRWYAGEPQAGWKQYVDI